MAVFLIACVLIALGVVLLRDDRHAAARGADAPAVPPPIGTPKDLLVSFPLNRQPVPGWQLGPTDIGLPAGVKVGNLFARNGTKAYFVTLEGCAASCQNPTGWVYGLDTTNGARLFAPLALPGFFGTNSDCHSNGPSVAVCTSRTEGQEGKLPPPGAWVIDLEHGALTYHGPNTLNPKMTGGTRLQAVGYQYGPSYLVAANPGEGLHGVGAHAELTWSLPGDWEVFSPATYAPDIPALTLAAQPPKSTDDRRGYRVFSVVDGKDLTPTPPSGTRLEEVALYNGGFAFQFDAGKTTGTLMYDSTGRQVGRQEGPSESARSYPRQNAAMLTLAVGGALQIYDAAGKLVANIPSGGSSNEFRTIGTKLFAKTPGNYGVEADWLQWDLLTTQPGPTCTMNLGPGYVGSDGAVLITTRRTDDGSEYVAIDTATCQTLWQIPGKTWIHKIGTGMIEIDLDHDKVMSLTA